MRFFSAYFLPSIEYGSWLELLRRLKQAVVNLSEKGFIIFTTHPSVITLGKHAKERNLLVSQFQHCKSIPIFRIDRGGDVTYHDNGQLMFYPVAEFKRAKSVSGLVEKMELSVKNLLADYDITSQIIPGKPGVWTDRGKIAAIGLSLRGGVISHGMALYVNTDRRNFQCIIPCGIKNSSVASMADFVGNLPEMAELSQKWLGIIAELFSLDINNIEFIQSEKEIYDGLQI